MTVVLVAADARHEAAVNAAAQLWAVTTGAAPRTVPVDDAVDAEDLLSRMGAADVAMAVLPGSGALSHPCWTVARRAAKPVLLVPERFAARRPRLLTALIPLDGSAEAAAAVARTSELLATAGVQLVVVHVFGTTSVPRYWDQGPHAQEAWESEFLARYSAAGPARIAVRSGRAGEQVLAVASREDADLIALGWSRSLDPGRAATVRETVAAAAVPVLLTPVARQPAAAPAPPAAR